MTCDVARDVSKRADICTIIYDRSDIANMDHSGPDGKQKISYIG